MAEPPVSPQPERTGRSAFFVGAGIFLSRIAGLVRDRVFAHFFGNSAAADAFRAAFRIPNFLQNLFGEGVLSASFIPVYANLLARGRNDEARRVAGAVFALLALVVSVLVLGGVLATPWLIDLIVPGFEGARRELAITLVRILFPGTGILVLSAWCLGILNSHRRFFLSYSAPVAWNLVIILALLGFGSRLDQYPLAVAVAWAAVAGSAAQFVAQLPVVLRLGRGLALSLGWKEAEVRTVVANFFPVFLGRGVVQISAFFDAWIASLLPIGALAALSYAQTLYLLPIGLFAMSVSAAELPAMSSALGGEDEVHRTLRRRVTDGLSRMSFFVVPSTMAFLALGDVVSGTIYQTGRFERADAVFVWSILAGYALGLPASTSGRLCSSAFYALKDTRTPLRFAIVRVVLAAALGYTAAVYGPEWLGIDQHWGVAGLPVATGAAAWVEYLLLRSALQRRIGRITSDLRSYAVLWGSAAAGVAAGWGMKILVGVERPLVLGVSALGVFGVVYLGLAILGGARKISDFRSSLRRIT